MFFQGVQEDPQMAEVREIARERAPSEPLHLPDPSSPESTVGETAEKFVQNVPELFKRQAGGLLQHLAESPPSIPTMSPPPRKPGQTVEEWQRERIEEWETGRTEAWRNPPPTTTPLSEYKEQQKQQLIQEFISDGPIDLPDLGPEPPPSTLSELGEKIFADASADIAANSPNIDPESAKGYAYDLATALTNMAPMMATSLATRNPSAGLSIMGTQVYGDRYGEQRAAGRTEAEANQDALFSALAETIPERIPLGIIMKQGGKFLSRVFASSVAEGGQEIVTEILNLGYDMGVLDETMTWGEALYNLKRAGLLGMGMGGGMAVMATPFIGKEPPPPPPGFEVRQEDGPGVTPPPPPPEAPPGVPEGALPAEDVIGAEEPATATDDMKNFLKDDRSLDEIREDFRREAERAKAVAAQADAAQEFQVTDEWQTVPEGAVLPDGVQSEMDMETGESRVRFAPGEGTREKPADAAVPGAVDQAAAQIDPAPSPKQKDAENYKMAHAKWRGLDISIETAKGGTRTARDGSWTVPDFPAHYGRFKGTVGMDGDHVDTFIGDNLESDQVFVIDQIDPRTGKPDEHKVMLGFDSSEAAIETYGRAFADDSGPSRIGAVTPMSADQLKGWLANGNTKKPLSYKQPTGSTAAPAAVAGERGELPATPQVAADGSAPGAEISDVEAKRIQASVNRSEAARNRKPRRPLDIVQFIASIGGISDPDGDLKAMDAHLKFVPGYGKLVRAGGLHPDRVREAAAEIGYLPTVDQSTISDLLTLVAENLRGNRQFSAADQSRVQELADEEVEKDYRRVERQVRKVAADNNIRLTDNEIANIASKVYGDRDAGDIIDEIIEFAERNYIEAAEDYVRETGDLSGLAFDIPGFEKVTTDETKLVEDRHQGRGAVDEEAVAQARPETKAAPADEARGEPAAERGGPAQDMKPPEPTTEPTPQGEQAVVPGAEKISDKQLVERRMEGGKKATVAQKEPDEGLFDVGGRGQGDLVDMAREPAPATVEKTSEADMAAALKGFKFADQYLAAKKANPDAILLYRFGDFLEAMFSDAEIVSNVLGITLTKRGAHPGLKPFFLAGIPVHSAPPYIKELEAAGHKVVEFDPKSQTAKSEAKPEPAAAPAAPKPLSKVAARIRKVADNLESKADASLAQDRQANTPRRARMAHGAEEQARKEKAFAITMRQVADAMDAGEATALAGVRSKADIEELDNIVQQAHYERADADAKADKSKRASDLRDRPLSEEDVKFIKYPEIRIWPEAIDRFLRDLGEVKGYIRDINQVKKMASRSGSHVQVLFDHHNLRHMELLNALLNAAKKKGMSSYQTDSIKDPLTKLKRVKEGMGLRDLDSLKAAAREYIGLREGAKKEDPIKALERSLVGAKLPGFFPTPPALVDRMVREAKIEDGMDVLEPSAGKGDIADVIKAEHPGAKLSVVEMSSTLRDILEKKGHDLVDSDFTEHEGEYDRIVMNPPFEQGQDAEHVQRAYEMLRPGGRLVAIMGAGSFQRSDKKAVAFREWLEEHDGESTELDEGTFKSAFRPTGVATRFVVVDKPDGDSFALTETPGLFSKAVRVIADAKTNKARGAQWLATLRNAGVKEEEIAWLGLDTFLKAGVAVTKADLEAYARANQVELREVTKAERGNGMTADDQVFVERIANSNDRTVGQLLAFVDDGSIENGEELGINEFDFSRLYILAENNNDAILDAPKFSTYTLPGGENYKELVLTLPTSHSTTNEMAQKHFDKPFADLTDSERDFVTRELRIEPPADEFRGGHYDEPNVLAHVRFNERTVDGKKVLFIEEIQSDWHQKGRRQGYKSRRSIAEIDKEMDANLADLQSREPRETDLVALWQRHPDLWARHEVLQVERYVAKNPVPDAPFKKTWHELTFRRMVRYAAENGFDSVAWTTGEQQAERYDLSKHVDTIDVFNHADGGRSLDIRKNEASILDFRYDENGKITDGRIEFIDKPMADVVGKDMADKILAVPPRASPLGVTNLAKRFEGLDLKIGGQGMKSFYDRMLPNYANKFGKKFGAKAGRINIGLDQTGQYRVTSSTDPTSSFVTDARGADNAKLGDPDAIIEPVVESGTVHSMPITDAMRETALGKGFPMFAAAKGKQAKTSPVTEQQIAEILRRIAPHANLLIVPDVFPTGLGKEAKTARGRFVASKQLAIIALNEEAPYTVRHEGIHALRSVGMFEKKEWRLLENLSRNKWRDQYNIDARYRKVRPQISESELTEEGIAFAYEHWAVSGKADPRVKRLFQRIKDWFERFRNALRGLGLQTVDDVFGRVERGEVGRRPGALPKDRQDQFAFLTEQEADESVATESKSTGYAWIKEKRKTDDGTEYWVAYTTFTPLKATDPSAPAPKQLVTGKHPRPGRFDEFAQPEPRAGGLLKEGEDGLFALISPDEDGKVASEAKRARAMQGFIAKGHPIDRAMRMPFHIFGGIDEKGEWKPGRNLSRKSADIIANAKFDKEGRFSWLNPVLHAARAGLMDRYGLPEDYVTRERRRGLQEREVMAEANEILTLLKNENIGTEEAKVLQAVLTGEEIPSAEWAKLADPIRKAIDTLGEEAVTLGLVSPESFERNKGTYLHRVYAKHETQVTTMGRWVTRAMTSKRKKIIGNQFKGRGMFLDIKVPRLMRDNAEYAQGRRGYPVTGEKFTVLDRIAEQGEFEGMESGKEKVADRVYWPADKPIPERYADYTDKGVWEARFTRGRTVTLWRDFTKAERASMGEILDARYTIAKTFMLMAHDLANGRFYKDIAENEEWSRGTEPPTKWLDGAEFNRVYTAEDIEWVKVPDTTIPHSGGKKKWAALAGRYVRTEIWRDLNELDVMQKRNIWSAALTQWKLNKTARSPVVHMNNIMSNIMFMDMADVRVQDLVKGLRSYVKGDRFYRDAANHGAFGGDMMTQEIRKQVMEPVLREIMKIPTAGQHPLRARLGIVGAVMGGIWDKARALDQKMVDLYRIEDEVFRMATYMRRLSLGDNPEQAAIYARQQFLDYDIRAPWVNALRRSVLPFISYTYRAAPVIAKSISTRPWKLAKYFSMAYAANALAYMIEPGDEDEERRSMRDEERGYTWVQTPRMMRMPFRDKHGNPVFLDIRRWIPAGDIFDLAQGQSAIDLPAPILFGGPLMMAAEIMLNKQSFTGKEIINDKTDDIWAKGAKIGDWAWKSWLPSAAWVPGSWYWEKIGNAAKGATDRRGTPYSLPLAITSSVGIKLKPQDMDQNFAYRQWEFEKVERDLQFQMRQAGDKMERGLISREAFEAERDRIVNRLKALGKKSRERLKRTAK